MKLAEEFCAVGVAHEQGNEPCIFVTFPHIKIQMPERQARKLADDILRNANYFWPIEEQSDET